MAVEFLSRHKHRLYWLHIALVGGTICALIPALACSSPLVPTLGRGLLVFLLATIAFSQNLGLVHHCAHQLPRGPHSVGVGAARLLHYLGGLPYTRTCFAHRLHHAHLGTARDPDRAGYETTTTVFRRLRYLLFIGPLRARFAPVDISFALDAMPPERRAAYERDCRRDWRLVGVTHVVLMGLCGLYYPIVFAALLCANVLSNVREMAEHGNDGTGAFVDIRVSPIGVALFSTPGFWFHGIHHIDPRIHYLDLPLASRSPMAAERLPYLHRSSAVAYLFTGR